MTSISLSYDDRTIFINWSYPLSGTSAQTQKLAVTDNKKQVAVPVDFPAVVHHLYSGVSCHTLNCVDDADKERLQKFLEEWVDQVYNKFSAYEEINLPNR